MVIINLQPGQNVLEQAVDAVYREVSNYWETVNLVGRRRFVLGEDSAACIRSVFDMAVAPPSSVVCPPKKILFSRSLSYLR